MTGRQGLDRHFDQLAVGAGLHLQQVPVDHRVLVLGELKSPRMESNLTFFMAERKAAWSLRLPWEVFRAAPISQRRIVSLGRRAPSRSALVFLGEGFDEGLVGRVVRLRVP